MSKTYLKEAVPAAQVANALAGVKETVSGVIADIRERGDEAVREYSAKFDNWSPESFLLSARQVDFAKFEGQIEKAEHQLRAMGMPRLFEAIENYRILGRHGRSPLSCRRVRATVRCLYIRADFKIIIL